MTAAEILATSNRRPIPLPNRPWVMRQEWHDLLFAHWTLEPASVRPLIPQPLELDLRENKSYLAITPFMVRRLRPRGAPALPAVSNFPEPQRPHLRSLSGHPRRLFLQSRRQECFGGVRRQGHVWSSLLPSAHEGRAGRRFHTLPVTASVAAAGGVSRHVQAGFCDTRLAASLAVAGTLPVRALLFICRGTSARIPHTHPSRTVAVANGNSGNRVQQHGGAAGDHSSPVSPAAPFLQVH